MKARLWLALAMLAVLLLCSISFGADGPVEYMHRPIRRSAPVSSATTYVGEATGDRMRCFSVSLVDTTGYGVDMTYTDDVVHNWAFTMPDSGSICDCYEIGGTPDTLALNNVWIPGKGRKESANQFSTDSRGRLKMNRTVRADTMATSVIASKTAAGTVVSTDTLRVMMHARVASNLKVQGQTQLGNAVADTVKLIGNVRAQGSLTTQGTTTLGNAAADVITSKGAFTAEDDLTAGNDSTDRVIANGYTRMTVACKTFTYPSGVTTTTFTWPKCGSWYYFGMFRAASGKAFTGVYKTGTDTITANIATILAAGVECVICAWLP